MTDSKHSQDHDLSTSIVITYTDSDGMPVTQIYNNMFVEEFGGVVHIRGRRSHFEFRETDQVFSDQNAILNLAQMLADANKKISELKSGESYKQIKDIQERDETIRKLTQELEELKKGIVTVDETNLEGVMLKELREVHGWSRSDIAAELGVSSEYVRLIERGDRKPSHPIRYKIRKLLR